MLTASIVVHRTPPGQLAAALECLLRSDVEKVYVVDNSPDDSLRAAVPSGQRTEYIRMENRGFGAGHNLAIRRAMNLRNEMKASGICVNDCAETSAGDYHLVMNADVWWQGDVPARLVRYMRSHPDVGLTAPKVYYPDGDLQYTCRMLPTPTDLLAKRFMPRIFVKRRMERYLLAAHDHDAELNCPYLLGCFMLFRMEALAECGLFDERFFMYPEDIDITRRIHEKWKTVYNPEVSIIHRHAAESRKNLKMLMVHIVNMTRYFNKWGWMRDKKRSIFNKTLLQNIKNVPYGRRPAGRG